MTVTKFSIETPGLYHEWEFGGSAYASAVVLPDGCADVLRISTPNRPDELMLTTWDSRPRGVQLDAGTQIRGYRLRPGARIDPRSVFAQRRGRESLAAFVEREAIRSDDADEVINALLARGSTVASASKNIGVATRTLQRRLKELALPCPEFWRLLGRARCAVPALIGRTPLADIADESGYSDQAHMTREFVHWFGCAPKRVRNNPVILDQLFQPGLGNWTGEQISIR